MNGGALALRSADLRVFDGEPRIADVRIAEVLGFDRPRKIRELIRRNIARLERHGPLFSADERLRPTVARSRATTVYYLNEKQAYRLCMWSEAPNADIVQEQMIEVFVAWKHGQLATKSLRRPKRAGRGKLSSIDLLADACCDEIAWAKAELRKRALPQTHILRQFNALIAAKGHKPISKGAFSRFSINFAIEIVRFEQDRRITEEVIARMGPGDRSEAMIATAELLRERLSFCAGDDGDASPRSIGNAALALQRLSNVAARENEQRRKERKGGTVQ